MKNLFIINEEEKNRILNLHENATKRHYLSEQTTAPIIVTNNDNAYEYKLENGQYTFRGKPGTKYAKIHPDWVASKTQDGANAIKNVIDTKGKQSTTTEPVKTVTTTVDASKAATDTANTTTGTQPPSTDTTNTTTGTKPVSTDTTQPVTGTQPSSSNTGSGVVAMKSSDIFTTGENPTTSTETTTGTPTGTFSNNPANKIPEFKGFNPNKTA